MSRAERIIWNTIRYTVPPLMFISSFSGDPAYSVGLAVIVYIWARRELDK